jgi:hypothetical protein
VFLCFVQAGAIAHLAGELENAAVACAGERIAEGENIYS